MHARSLRLLALTSALSFALAACGGGGGGGGDYGGGGGGGGGGVPQPNPGATSQPGFTCPASATTFSVARDTASRRATPASSRRAVNTATSAGLIAVTYRTAAVAQPANAIDTRVQSAGGRFVAEQRFSAIGRATRLYSVAPAQAQSAIAALQSQPGVVKAQLVQRAHALTTNAYLTNDPFFDGQAGSIAPLYETASTSGQWDMHIMGLEHAFAYSQPGNGSGIVDANALGSTNVKLAIIDTGEDTTHPDLAGAHVVRTDCLLTDDNGVQSTGSFVTDPTGHGTDVTGIAAATVNNGYGFAGAGGNVSLMLYRVFPTPDDTCATGTPSQQSSDSRCGATDVDVADAINDAVSYGANVINLSVGVGTCTNGVDSDAVEGSAIANAIANNVIVVASSGNGGGSGVSSPACDTGVIAVGASAYNDGQPNGSNYTGPNTEYQASYSQYGTTTVPRNPASWGLLAPGGDASGVSDPDDLHWVQNIWTTTPYDANFAAYSCTDPFGQSGDCYALINGTSMAAAHVSGAAALVLSVSGTSGPYATPASMFQLLCTTADDIRDPNEGCGRVNVYRAVATAEHDPNLP